MQYFLFVLYSFRYYSILDHICIQYLFFSIVFVFDSILYYYTVFVL